MAAKKKKRTRRRFSTETKAEAVAALNAGTKIAKLEKRFGVTAAQIYAWRKAGLGNGSAPKKKPLSYGKDTDALLALSLDETIRLIVRDELTKLADLRRKLETAKR